MIGDFVNYLLADGTFSGLCGGRVYTGRLQESSLLPAVAVHIISDLPLNTHDGQGSLDTARLQVDLYARTAEAADALRQRLKAIANQKRATQGSTLFGYFEISTTNTRYEKDINAHAFSCDVTVVYSPV